MLSFDQELVQEFVYILSLTAKFYYDVQQECREKQFDHGNKAEVARKARVLAHELTVVRARKRFF